MEKRLEEIKVELKGDIVIEVMEELKEIEDKKSRDCNLILYNVPESTKTVSRDRMDEDGSYCEKLFTEGVLVNRKDFTITDIIRLGKRGENERPRPILVKLQSGREKWNILKNARNLRKCTHNGMNTISIAPDLTIREREQDKKVRNELKIKKENGENDWFIKNGKLVKKNFQQRH